MFVSKLEIMGTETMEGGVTVGAAVVVVVGVTVIDGGVSCGGCG